jgi:hypothetical protein
MIPINIILLDCIDNMKAERLLLTMIVAAAVLVTPSVLTSPILAQGTADEEDGNQGTTRGAQGTADEEDGNQGTTRGADDESPGDLYDEFQTCLETAEGGTGGTGAFATEDEIRDCFIEVGYTGSGDDNDNQDEDENDEEENEGDDGETNTQ